MSIDSILDRALKGERLTMEDAVRLYEAMRSKKWGQQPIKNAGMASGSCYDIRSRTKC